MKIKDVTIRPLSYHASRDRWLDPSLKLSKRGHSGAKGQVLLLSLIRSAWQRYFTFLATLHRKNTAIAWTRMISKRGNERWRNSTFITWFITEYSLNIHKLNFQVPGGFWGRIVSEKNCFFGHLKVGLHVPGNRLGGWYGFRTKTQNFRIFRSDKESPTESNHSPYEIGPWVPWHICMVWTYSDVAIGNVQILCHRTPVTFSLPLAMDRGAERVRLPKPRHFPKTAST